MKIKYDAYPVSVDDDEEFYANNAPDCLKNRGGSIYLRRV